MNSLKHLLTILTLVTGTSTGHTQDAPLLEISPGIMTADLIKRRTALFDYEAPNPCNYRLPVLGAAVDGVVTGPNGKPVPLHELMRGRVVVLSFMEAPCPDPVASMRAGGPLSDLQNLSRQRPDLARNLLLITLQLDPEKDAPAGSPQWGRVRLAHGEGAEWLLLSARDQTALGIPLEKLHPRTERSKTSGRLVSGCFLRHVHLVDPQQRIRNVYHHGLMDPRLVATDALNLLAESPHGGHPAPVDSDGDHATACSPKRGRKDGQIGRPGTERQRVKLGDEVAGPEALGVQELRSSVATR